MSVESPLIHTSPSFDFPDRETALQDYRLMYKSREASLLGRREVLTGKAKFGIFGDGKELPQLAMAKVFQPGDIRSGYYRDQTFAFATGIATFQEFFAQLYADTDIHREPHSGGRQMNSHFATRLIDPATGEWLDQTAQGWTTSDASPTASQMPRMVGLALASRQYRHRKDLHHLTHFSRQGREVVFGTIGNASSAEGHFWETLNAVGVLQAPLVMSIWDDEYGISVSNEHQLMKPLHEMLSGFQRSENHRGFEVFTVRAWDYPELIRVYSEAAALARNEHVPSIIHVVEVTQPQGHSTSGSHERYKPAERLEWEKAHDCLLKMREWLILNGYATEEEITQWEREDKQLVWQTRKEAWESFRSPIEAEKNELLALLDAIETAGLGQGAISSVRNNLERALEPKRRDLIHAAHLAIVKLDGVQHPLADQLKAWKNEQNDAGKQRYNTHLYDEYGKSALQVSPVPARYPEQPKLVNGYEVLNLAFEDLFARDPRVIAFGEDVGFLGDVNQGMAGLQAKFGPMRVFDTGIREATIMGQAIGLALRGLRPIAEIQYLDYFIYGLQTLSDDASTLLYRTAGGQRAPIIIRTRGHRLEGIWHAGSPLGMMLNSLRGMHICVPRNMTQAAGMYHTLIKGEDPAVVIEVLNGYRLKEAMPENLTEYCVPLGVPEVIRAGEDLTIVTYGACCRIALDAAKLLAEVGIEVEIIDVQTLLPFDREGRIVRSLEKTNRIIFLDEDVPGGASAYMMQQVLEVQKGFFLLDSAPRTLTAEAHRPAYGDDGDFWSKPQVADVFDAVYAIMREAEPGLYPDLF